MLALLKTMQNICHKHTFSNEFVNTCPYVTPILFKTKRETRKYFIQPRIRKSDHFEFKGGYTTK